jgi:hypothetical protein
MVDEDKEVYYIRDLVTSAEADDLSGFCSETEGRWVRSPMRKKSGDSGVEEEGARTSTSCPLLFAYFYMPLIDQLRVRLATGREDPPSGGVLRPLLSRKRGRGGLSLSNKKAKEEEEEEEEEEGGGGGH